MKGIRKFSRYILLLLAACLVLSGCNGAAAPAVAEAEETSVTVVGVQETSTAVTEAEETSAAVMEAEEPSGTENEAQSISVAIYPYIPDMELFENVLTRQWSRMWS